jgi:ribosomal protein L24
MKATKVRISNKEGKTVYPKKNLKVKIYRGKSKGKSGNIIKINKKGYAKINIGTILKDIFINTHYNNLGI